MQATGTIVGFASRLGTSAFVGNGLYSSYTEQVLAAMDAYDIVPFEQMLKHAGRRWCVRRND